MKKIRTRLLPAAALILIVLLLAPLQALAKDAVTQTSSVYGTFWALIPPIIAILH